MSVAVAAPHGLRAQSIDYHGTLSYAGGSYDFDRRADSWYLGNGLGLRAGPFRASLDIPLILHDQSAVSYTAGTLVPTGGMRGRAGSTTTSGGTGGMGAMGVGSMGGGGRVTLPPSPGYRLDLGDPYGTLGAGLFRGLGAMRAVDLTATVKAPLADTASGVGTGAWDGALSLSLTFAPARRVLLFLDGGYWWFGDSPGLTLNNAFSYGAALGTTLGDGRWALLGGLSGSGVVVPGTEAPVSAHASVLRTSGRHSISLGIAAGLSDSVSGIAMSLGWRTSLH